MFYKSVKLKIILLAFYFRSDWKVKQISNADQSKTIWWI